MRAALLDVNASKQLVDVARSNVDLATRALSDETDRVNAGVDNNLPLVTAQATLATAESNLVESLYQYNVSKLSAGAGGGRDRDSSTGCIWGGEDQWSVISGQDQEPTDSGRWGIGWAEQFAFSRHQGNLSPNGDRMGERRANESHSYA